MLTVVVCFQVRVRDVAPSCHMEPPTCCSRFWCTSLEPILRRTSCSYLYIHYWPSWDLKVTIKFFNITFGVMRYPMLQEYFTMILIGPDSKQKLHQLLRTKKHQNIMCYLEQKLQLLKGVVVTTKDVA